MNPEKCPILVPTNSYIEPHCEQGLHELEDRGYPVVRTFGASSIDLCRSLMATQVLRDDYEEMFFIDSDITFHPDDVDKIRAHNLPFCCATYWQKGTGCDVCRFVTKEKAHVGELGGLYEITACGFGFVHVRKPVFDAVRANLTHKFCDGGGATGITPYFLPMTVESKGLNFYLPEDYAFCHRAKEAGVKLMCDTSVVLFHVGKYGFSVLDNGKKMQAFFNPTNTPLGETNADPGL